VRLIRLAMAHLTLRSTSLSTSQISQSLLDIRPSVVTIPLVSEIKLSGGEITILKTLGLTGASMAGTQLLDRIDEMEGAEFLDTLTGLIEQDYVVANRVNIRTMESAREASFRVNAAISRELREAIYPSRHVKPETGRRRRRS
jgi:hypothetical protein